jgi:hypothetical protein
MRTLYERGKYFVCAELRINFKIIGCIVLVGGRGLEDWRKINTRKAQLGYVGQLLYHSFQISTKRYSVKIIYLTSPTGNCLY